MMKGMCGRPPCFASETTNANHTAAGFGIPH